MPRRKANDRAGPVKTRSREGCSECRASRVRCDTKKPVCTRCQERGLTCATPLVLKWESEFTSRGQAFGRAGVWSKSGKHLSTPSPSSSSVSSDDQVWCATSWVEPWNFVSTSVDTLELPYEVEVTDDDRAVVLAPPPARRVQVTGPTLSLPLFPHLSGTNQGHLFEYYIEQVCPRMTASASAPSPFASIIIPFCTTASPTVLKAIQALGACTWSRTDPTYSAVGLRLKSEAIRGLRNSLSSAGSSPHSSYSEILVVMMLMCLYELVDHCDQQWTIHLRGAKELIGSRWQQKTLMAPEPDEVTSFAEQFFAFQDIMGRTACGKPRLLGTDHWQHNKQNVDAWMGCSPELVAILSDITDLSQTRRQLASDSARATLSLKAANLCKQLEDLVQDVDEGDEDLRAIAELKRLAAVLYLHCTLYNASPTSAIVARYVRRILKTVSDMLDKGLLIGLAWPVFVAAVELDPLNDELWKDADGNEVYGRPVVLRALAAMSESSVLSVARTRAVIVKVWQARDNILKLSTSNELEDTSNSNDWEHYVVPFSTAMSLV